VDAVITAGGIPQPGEPLYEVTQGKSKALLDVAGKPMVQWVLDALCQSTVVERIAVVGLPPESNLQCSKLIDYLPNQNSMLENIRAGVNKIQEYNPDTQHVLLVSSDIPAITGEMVDWVARTALQTDDDVYYNVIRREVMEARFPNSRRSFTRLRGMEVCGGDLNLMHVRMLAGKNDVWEKIIASRKNVFKQAALIGYDTLVLLMLRLIDVDQAVKMVSKRLKIKGRGLVCPYAEIGMDVDKPFQLEMVRADLSRKAQA